jgi:hypothetical protein
MHPFVQYATYVIKHKAMILRLSRKWGVPLWQALIHDLSRFLPSEFIPSANYFFGAYKRGYVWKRGESPKYDAARDLHERRNPHHAAYWAGRPIPLLYIREMLCDWDAAGQAKGKPINEWYTAHRHSLPLHPDTIATIDQILASPSAYAPIPPSPASTSLNGVGFRVGVPPG